MALFELFIWLKQIHKGLIVPKLMLADYSKISGKNLRDRLDHIESACKAPEYSFDSPDHDFWQVRGRD